MLGLIEFYKQVASGPGTPSEQAKVIAFAKPPGNASATAESGMQCPACESTIIQKVPGGRRCGSCGVQFGMQTFTSKSSEGINALFGLSSSRSNVRRASLQAI